MASFPWNEKVVLITGASEGIGGSCAKLIGQRGAKVSPTALPGDQFHNEESPSRIVTARDITDAETRRAWLETLLEAELADIEMGGIDLAPSAREAVLEHANDEEWVWIGGRLDAAMSKSHGWEREELARFLAAGQKRHGQAGKAATKRKKPGVAKH